MARASGFSEDIHSEVSLGRWQWCGDSYPKQEIIFCAQTLLVYIVCIASLANLSYGTSESSLWICLLSSCIGYMLPNPSVKRKKMRDPVMSNTMRAYGGLSDAEIKPDARPVSVSQTATTEEGT